MKKIFLLSILIASISLWVCCTGNPSSGKKITAEYTGNEKCQSCHQQEYKEYLSSNHYHAMDTALGDKVRADFNNTYFIYFGDTSFFYKKGDAYFVRTKDSDGVKKEFAISYTFGWYPLQQYIVKFNDGRMQVLPFCWDTRPKENGGQHWFHLYGANEKILPGDELFWTGYNQNWNHMCADCHTTGLQQNFDFDNNSFHTAWYANRVTCESCHGPASNHIKWTENKDESDTLKGFTFSLYEKNVEWIMDNAKGIAYRNKPPANDLLVQTCARCHARAEHIDGNYIHGQSIFNTHIPAELNTDFYHTDGQQLGEDYEYGSFLQSKMYAMGVTCNNCHNTHSGQLKLAGNAVCSQCHSPQVFDVPQHTNHPVNTAGAQCISCHMPSKNYMQIDARLDHKIFIPRPDLSTKLNTPDACSSCHADKTKSWVVNAFEKWYGEKIKQKPVIYGELLSKVNKYEEKGDSAMIQLLAANAYPSIVQATAMLQAYNYTSPAIAEPLTQSLSSGNDLLRYYSLRAISNFPAEQITAQVSPLLADATLAVRAEAARILAPVNDKLDAASKQKFDTAIAEYINIQKFNGNRPESYMNTGIVLQEMQKFTDAQQMYELGIKRFPKFEALYINLADVYRNGNRDDLCESTLQKVLAINPSNAVALQSYGFLLVRKNKTDEAISYLKKAADMQPAEADYSYSYAVALFSTGKTKEAVSLLENFQKKNPNNPIIINTLISFYQQMQMQDKANAYNEIRKKVFGG